MAQPAAIKVVLSEQPQSAPLSFFSDIRGILLQARRKAYAATNATMVHAYWAVGERIVQEEQNGKDRADYGSALISGLARQLGAEFGQGLSVANLWNFRQFYLCFPSAEKLYALRRELTWTHWRLVMRVYDEPARAYYIHESAEHGWSSRRLEREIKTRSFDRLINKPTSSQTKDMRQQANAEQFLKDPYVLEFLGLPEAPIAERALEAALVTRIQEFLMELGKGFSFVAKQMRISTETSHFYVDLVFYNYLLKCFVLIDLKTQKLSHADIGQMDMYVRLFDDLKRGEDDNPTLGIILCADKDDTLVRYSVLSESQQLFASKYRLILPTEEELRDELERRHILQPPPADEAARA